MTVIGIEPKKAGLKIGHRFPLWAGVACVLAAFLIGMIVVETGLGGEQTTKAVPKTHGQYFRAAQWLGHLSTTTMYIAMGILLAGILVGMFGFIWRSSF
jgi:hypothetical protein